MPGFGTGHSCVDGYLLHRCEAKSWRHVAHEVIGWQVRALDQLRHGLGGRREEWERVAEIAVDELFVHTQNGVVPVIAFESFRSRCASGGAVEVVGVRCQGANEVIESKFCLTNAFVNR